MVTCNCLCTVEFVGIIKLLDCNFEPIIIYLISIRFGVDFSIVSSPFGVHFVVSCRFFVPLAV